MKGSAFFATAALAVIGDVVAWGNDGHEAVGYVAQQVRIWVSPQIYES